MDSGQLKSITVKGINTSFIDIKNTQAIIDLIYPVGSVYISMGDQEPSTLFGGTWEIITKGHFLEATETVAEVSTEVQAGLPNITGTFSNLYKGIGATMLVDVDTSGVFSKSGSRGYVDISRSSGSSGYPTNINFDASKGNSIYGKSSTVQPLSIKCRMWKRIS